MPKSNEIVVTRKRFSEDVVERLDQIAEKYHFKNRHEFVAELIRERLVQEDLKEAYDKKPT